MYNICDNCGATIYEDDYLVDADGNKWCDDCITDIIALSKLKRKRHKQYLEEELEDGDII